MTMESLKILVVGATGAQGSATVAALANSAPAHIPLNILALTRSASVPKAQALSQKFPGVTLIEGDLTDPAAIFKSHSDIASVFLVTVPPNDESHGIAFINAAISHRIPHLVFSSVDRGGDARSWDNPTTVSHFAAKHRVELHLRTVAEKSHTRWTIIRPTGFMDNYRPSSFGKMMAGLWATMPSDTKMQLISVSDIGKVAAKILLDPDRWAGKAIGLAGDELTFSEASGIYERIYGHEMPRVWGLIGSGIRWAVGEAGESMEWFERGGFKVDIVSLKQEGWDLQNFESWLENSDF